MRRLLGLALVSSTVALAAQPVSPVVEELLPRVVKVMGLPLPRKVKVKLVSRAEAEAVLRRGRPQLAQLGAALRAVGLLPEGTKLETLAPDYERQNVSGFYDLQEHTLFLLADQSDEAQRPIIAHELAHAVQDANVDLFAAMNARRGSEDAQLAFTAVLEGQAQATAALVMDGWLRDQHVAVEGMAGLLSDTAARSAAEAAEHAPAPWLGLQLRFPYVAGRALVEALGTAEDPIARGLLRSPPASTAQVLSPARTAAPLEGALHLDKLIPGARRLFTTTLGRANLELLGADVGEGWRGDRLESVQLGAGTVVVWVVAFDTEAQAARFAGVAKCAVAQQTKSVALLCGVPASRETAVRAAALTLF